MVNGLTSSELKDFLNEKSFQYNQKSFIESDPIQVPHVFTKKEDIENYLNPAIKNLLPNPSILKGMDKASSRTVKAIINKEKIGIFGDYDVDGATSTAILGQYFRSLKINYEIGPLSQ